jgi:hypothetical protein
MKKYFITVFFVVLVLITATISLFIINQRLDGEFTYTEKTNDLSDKEIYQQAPEFVGRHSVYRKYKLTKQFSKGYLFPLVHSDTTFDNTIFATND